ncbi:MAG: S-methyl-5-thioribose-1-phosphate isomerase [Leptospiraceae bacterium]|nr:S-methyl-5-thioribose-1-phosphate isomerase [Leptospiraceae bacterium]
MNQLQSLKCIIWENNQLQLLDQRLLPARKVFINCKSHEDVFDSIRNMVVRGAPAIGVTSLFGPVLFLKSQTKKPSFEEFQKVLSYLESARPTAVNLKQALDSLIQEIPEETYEALKLSELQEKTESFAINFYKKDLETNQAIARNGSKLFYISQKKLSILTHCNTGALATAGIGTALGVIRALKDEGFEITVYVDETRPYNQGSRLTAWELEEEGIPYYLIADNMAGWLMKDRKIDAIIVGADRIALNGDTANKIGTYPLSIIAREHGVPFYVAAPHTSFDLQIESGDEIIIEMRPEDELTRMAFLKKEDGTPVIPQGVIAPMGAKALNPSFDVTPAKNIRGIITDKGIILHPTKESVLSVLQP